MGKITQLTFAYVSDGWEKTTNYIVVTSRIFGRWEDGNFKVGPRDWRYERNQVLPYEHSQGVKSRNHKHPGRSNSRLLLLVMSFAGFGITPSKPKVYLEENDQAQASGLAAAISGKTIHPSCYLLECTFAWHLWGALCCSEKIRLNPLHGNPVSGFFKSDYPLTMSVVVMENPSWRGCTDCLKGKSSPNCWLT